MIKLNTLKPNQNNPRSLTFNQLDDKFLEGFKAFLLSNVSQNTAWLYMSKIKALIHIAISDKILTTNPAVNTKISKMTTDRQFLTIEERDLLISTPCKHEAVKDAFIFSCYTGLRFTDIVNLTWDNIKDGYVSVRMQKTNEPIRIKLHTEAIKVLDRQDKSKRRVFYLLPTNLNVNKHIDIWTADAGITKHITFHCARHTFATTALTSGIDLYTLSKLMGHSSNAMTQVYAKIIDKVKDDAIDKLK